MKKTLYRKIFMILLLFTTSSFFIGCNSAPAQPTSTPSFPTETKTASPPTPTVSPSATATRSRPTRTPSITPSPTPPTPTITAPAPRNPTIELPDGLEIEEYLIDPGESYTLQWQIRDRHGYPWGSYWGTENIIDNEPITVEETGIPTNRAAPIKIFTIFIGAKEVYKFGCSIPHPMGELISVWAHNGHWYVQTFCNERFTVFSDGMPIDLPLGYQSSYAFQILDDKPFYMFTRDDKVWMFYDDIEVLLGYDEVMLRYCCMTFPPPDHYENMIFFIARTGEQYYGVAIGKFSETEDLP